MELSQQVVHKIPLESLWRGNTWLAVKRIKYLNQEEISEVLKNGPIHQKVQSFSWKNITENGYQAVSV